MGSDARTFHDSPLKSLCLLTNELLNNLNDCHDYSFPPRIASRSLFLLLMKSRARSWKPSKTSHLSSVARCPSLRRALASFRLRTGFSCGSDGSSISGTMSLLIFGYKLGPLALPSLFRYLPRRKGRLNSQSPAFLKGEVGILKWVGLIVNG